LKRDVKTAKKEMLEHLEAVEKDLIT